jgi:ABC-type antimicrobial peptide transport system permease subunit
MSMMPVVIVMASIVVVCVVGWLVSYTMRFMLQKRSRELGTYILLGIEPKQVAELFFRENLVVGGVAFVVGTLLGNLIFQCMRAIILAMFEIPYTFQFSLSPLALLLTLLYFALIYLLALRRCRRRIRKMKIGALLGYDRQNETEAVGKSKNRRRMFILSIISGVIGTALLVSGGGFALGAPGAMLIIVFLYGFFVSFSSGVPAFFDKHLALKYTGTNLLVYRTLASKLTTMGVTMATISLLITATLLTEGAGILFANLSTKRVEQTNAFDLIIQSEYETADFARYYDIIKTDIPVTADREYTIYSSGDDRVIRYIESVVPDYFRMSEVDLVMAASDYAALRSLLGYETVALSPGEYVIHCLDYIVDNMENMGVMIEKQIPSDYMENYSGPITLGGQALALGGVYNEPFSQGYPGLNGMQFILVVPDDAVTSLVPERLNYVAIIDGSITGEALAALDAAVIERYEANRTLATPDATVIEQYEAIQASADYHDLIYTRQATRNENALMNSVFVFPLFYLALILTMVAATILTIQLLSDVSRYQKQYALLGKLGMDSAEMSRALRRKFTLFYAMPAIPPVIICVIFMVWMGNLFDAGIVEGVLHLGGMIGVTLAAFFGIYAVYIAVSYGSFKRNVLPQ